MRSDRRGGTLVRTESGVRARSDNPRSRGPAPDFRRDQLPPRKKRRPRPAVTTKHFMDPRWAAVHTDFRTSTVASHGSLRRRLRRLRTRRAASCPKSFAGSTPAPSARRLTISADRLVSERRWSVSVSPRRICRNSAPSVGYRRLPAKARRRGAQDRQRHPAQEPSPSCAATSATRRRSTTSAKSS
jgi:hypothetical protein